MQHTALAKWLSLEGNAGGPQRVGPILAVDGNPLGPHYDKAGL